MEELITDSISFIGKEKADDLCSIGVNHVFFTAVVRYAILNDYNNSSLFSPDLTDILPDAKCPSYTSEFVGRKTHRKFRISPYRYPVSKTVSHVLKCFAFHHHILPDKI